LQIQSFFGEVTGLKFSGPTLAGTPSRTRGLIDDRGTMMQDETNGKTPASPQWDQGTNQHVTATDNQNQLSNYDQGHDQDPNQPHRPNQLDEPDQLEDSDLAEAGEESFAELFESYSAGMSEDIRVGDKIHGRIISISQSAVFVDTGTKADGVVEIEELKDEQGNLPYAVGDELDLYVVAADESEIRLSRAIAGIGGITMLREAQAAGIPVEGKVVQTIKGGFQVEVLKRRAFCPISQIDTSYVEKPELYVGSTYQFMVKKLTEGGRNIVLSRRDLLEAEQKKARQAFLQEIEVGQVHTGKITRVMPYGAFVELVPGLEGMVHVSEISWSRLDTPEKAVKSGDSVQVKILRMEAGQKGMKIALSIKQVLGDPWQQVDQKIRVNQKLNGTVTRCAPFGVFVEILPGVEGLVHISEMSYTQRVLKPEDLVEPGQSVPVVIKEIDLDKHRISLSMRDAAGDPWLDAKEKFTPGKAVAGTVQSREKFGIFVTLEPGIVGLLPKSVINKSTRASQIDKLKSGDTIHVAVERVNPADRKISLKLSDSGDEQNWRKFTGAGAAPALGGLGEKLAQALKDSKKK
jgi:small subunit ribosomal protein S1